MSKYSHFIKKIARFDAVIFDLDNTLISLKKYDRLVFKKICNTLIKDKEIKKRLYQKLLFLREREIKNLKKYNIFDKFFFKNESEIAVRIYNSFFPASFVIPSSNLKILKDLKKKKKELFLVTNGNKKRQLKKIKNLGISKYFNHIYILDGKKKKFKPSIYSLNSLLKKIEFKNTVMIGDSKIDEEFAKNLKIKYIKFYTY